MCRTDAALMPSSPARQKVEILFFVGGDLHNGTSFPLWGRWWVLLPQQSRGGGLYQSPALGLRLALISVCRICFTAMGSPYSEVSPSPN